MSKYVVTCCSTADLSKEYFDENNIPYAMFSYLLDGQSHKDDLYQSIGPKEFFDMIAKGAEPTTTQVSPADYMALWEPYLKEGIDVLHLTLSSGISGTYQSAIIAKESILESYPKSKIEVIDSLSASSGYGLLVKSAKDNLDSGMSFEDNVQFVSEKRNMLHHWFFSSDLTSFIRGGRVNKVSGFFGTMLNICPILNVNKEGKLIPRVKSRGKKKAITETLKIMKEHAEGGLDYSGKVFISHSNCEEDALQLKNLIEDSFKKMDGEVLLFNIGTVIGSHTGPGTVALFFYGDERTL